MAAVGPKATVDAAVAVPAAVACAAPVTGVDPPAPVSTFVPTAVGLDVPPNVKLVVVALKHEADMSDVPPLFTVIVSLIGDAVDGEEEPPPLGVAAAPPLWPWDRPNLDALVFLIRSVDHDAAGRPRRDGRIILLSIYYEGAGNRDAGCAADRDARRSLPIRIVDSDSNDPVSRCCTD